MTGSADNTAFTDFFNIRKLHPFSQPMTSEADLRSMVKNRSADLQAGFAKASYPDLYKEFSAQFSSAAIDSIKIAPGQQLDWMLFRNKGTGPIKVVKDVTWDGKPSFEPYRFYIEQGGEAVRVHSSL